MTQKRAFISFDFDNDKQLRGSLIAQARDPESPFNLVDRSVHEPFSEKWRAQIRGIIQKSDLVIVICGRHTHQAKGVEAEVSITRELNKPYFLLTGYRKWKCQKPANALKTDVIHRWKWKTLRELIANCG